MVYLQHNPCTSGSGIIVEDGEQKTVRAREMEFTGDVSPRNVRSYTPEVSLHGCLNITEQGLYQ